MFFKNQGWILLPVFRPLVSGMSIDLSHTLERAQLQPHIMQGLATCPLLTVSAAQFCPARRLNIATPLAWRLRPNPRDQDPTENHAFIFVEYFPITEEPERRLGTTFFS